MKNLFLALSFMLLVFPKKTTAQDLDAYKFVIVPRQYGFLDEPDEYQLNSLTAFLFEKYGFATIMEGEPFSEDLKKKPCFALNADVLSDSGMLSFVTKVKIILKDCNQQILFESKEGRSRLKKYKFAYQEALRDAFSSIDSLNHEYEESVSTDKKMTKPKEKPVFTEDIKHVYTFENREYMLSKVEKAWVLKEADAENPEAFLYETNTANFVFRSEKINGTAYFDKEENLVVEYFDESSGSMEKLVYEKAK